MGRIKTKDLLNLIETFYKEKRSEYGKKIKYVDICNFINSQGYTIDARQIRRKEEARDLIKKHEATYSEIHTIKLPSFSRYDFRQYLKKKITISDIERLELREDNLQNMYFSSAELFNQHNELLEQNAKLKKSLIDLKKKIDSINNKISKIKISDVKKENNMLKNLIDTYINPEIANQLMADAGIEISSNGKIDIEKIKEEIISIDTKIDMDDIISSFLDDLND